MRQKNGWAMQALMFNYKGPQQVLKLKYTHKCVIRIKARPMDPWLNKFKRHYSTQFRDTSIPELDNAVPPSGGHLAGLVRVPQHLNQHERSIENATCNIQFLPEYTRRRVPSTSIEVWQSSSPIYRPCHHHPHWEVANEVVVMLKDLIKKQSVYR